MRYKSVVHCLWLGLLLLSTKPLMAQQVQAIDPQQTSSEVRRSWLSVRSNTLADIAMVPNLGLEAFIGEHWSWELSGYGAWWSKPKANFCWRLKGLESEVKYWLGERKQGGDGHHVGLYGQLFDYDFQMGGRGALGDRTHFGLGVAYGYAWSLSKQWTLEGTIGIGYLHGTFKQYGKQTNGCFPWVTTKQLDFVGPTKLSLSIVYRLW
ncbi:MAG: DUF3575 domain-containing protein [Porphyromonas somerae]|uniref:DUF3575 domain-containing protein n=1 Tax=Porphyromonas somerae TaxID=322095 RepID=UPI0026EAB7CA|nr:DUF3575 domain-containing protein [Porphyromonas somerae]MDD7557580.1 DUF3575 domain-containing protein [Porphyromonas somerae]MDY5815158.1 DUF3575 domain-containing protein [Porphyromonas somerae]